MSAPLAPEVLGLLAEVSLEGSLVLLLGQALASRLDAPEQRHRVRALSLAALPVLALIELGWGGRPVLGLAEPLLAIWAVGMLVVGARLALSLVALVRATIGARRGPEGLLYSPDVAVPLTWGALRPVALMPLSSLAWTRQERQLAALHERAHILRGDWLVQVGTQLVAVVFWFHPLLWWTRRGLLLDAELAADRRVLEDGAVPTAYARHLLERCAELRSGVAATASSGPSQLGVRVRALLEPGVASARSGPALGLTALFALGLLLAAGKLSPLPDPPPPDCRPDLESS